MRGLICSVKTFWGKVISSTNESSHKRVIALGSFFMLTILSLINQLAGLDVNELFIYTFGALAGLQSTLSLFEKKTTKQDTP